MPVNEVGSENFSISNFEVATSEQAVQTLSAGGTLVEYHMKQVDINVHRSCGSCHEGGSFQLQRSWSARNSDTPFPQVNGGTDDQTSLTPSSSMYASVDDSAWLTAGDVIYAEGNMQIGQGTGTIEHPDAQNTSMQQKAFVRVSPGTLSSGERINLIKWITQRPLAGGSETPVSSENLSLGNGEIYSLAPPLINEFITTANLLPADLGEAQK